MIFRTILVLGLMITLSACATKDGEDTVVVGGAGEYEDVTGVPVDGDGVSREYVGGAEPGSQQDLTINIGDRVFFGYDRYDLTPDAQRTVELQAEWMQRYPNVTITIEGHCDERGTREYNLALGERRANAVKSYLVALGISSSRIEIISFGKERPAVVGTGATVWSQNRRGVTIVN
jgi:peptidoglycan-associated lipoprotein